MWAEGGVSESSRLCGEDGGDVSKLGAFLLLACNSRILIVGVLGVGARKADRRAELALRGVCGERGLLVCDTYRASLWFCLADPGRHRGVTCVGCLPGT